jgi:GNAT superfamily N-acetyltransferase
MTGRIFLDYDGCHGPQSHTMTPVMIGQTALGTPPAKVAIRPGGPSDIPAVLEMLDRCSKTSLFHRFHSPSDGIEYTKAQLRRPGDIIYLAWEGDVCVGMGVYALERREETVIAHLGVLVQDDRQRQGIGRRLIAAAARDAIDRGIGRVHADVMGEDVHLVRALRRLGSTDVTLETGEFSVDVALPPAA